MFQELFWGSDLIVLFLSLVGCAMIVLLDDKLRPYYMRRGDCSAVQASHIGDPLRIGGIAVFLAFTIGVTAAVPDFEAATGLLIAASAIPVFGVGMLEDFGHHVSPRNRLIAGFISAIFAVALLGIWAPRADIVGIDWLMGFLPFAVCLTLVFSAGMCHAVNLIDGMNGLSSFVALSGSLGIAWVASLAGQAEVVILGIFLAAAVAGFFFLNWPMAQLFMGDAGAYAIGHILAWLALTLAWRTDDVAVPSLLLLLFWPLADTLHTIVRRFANRSTLTRPDKMHLHQKVQRTFEILLFGRKNRSASNPIATLFLMPFVVTPVITGILLWNHVIVAWLALGAYLLAFFAAHPCLIWLCRKFHK
jgi:UDP-N-acetylmuramyl pentapeptide phosphotransferase/UDP-N-acetylglucosamine-1-phosphate transferase